MAYRHLGEETVSGGFGQCYLGCLRGAVSSLCLHGTKALIHSRVGFPGSRVVGTPCTQILTGCMKMHMPGLPNQTRRGRALESDFYWEGWGDAEKHI